MPNVVKYFIYSILTIGFAILAIMGIWIFLLVIFAAIIIRFIYAKIFNKEPFKFYTYKQNGHHTNLNNDQNDNKDNKYTTVIDADDMDKEYKIPKL
ncbi:MAG: hypothetical protein WCR27_10115 [Eubacteriales bacterium]